MTAGYSVKIPCLLLAVIIFLLVFSGAMTASAAGSAEIQRFGGDTRIDTAVKIADRFASEADGCDTVFIANGFSFPDALAGIPLAESMDAPILLTGGKSVEPQLEEELKRLSPENVYVLGGTGVISKNVEIKIKTFGMDVFRLCGDNRYDTAAAVASRQVTSGTDLIFVVSGETFPDALSVSPVAAMKDAPIIYADKSGGISDSEADVIRSGNISSAVIIGGTNAVGLGAEAQLKAMGVDSVERISGSTRYDTSAAIFREYEDCFKPGIFSAASGENFPDALAGGVLSGRLSAPLLLVKNDAPNKQAAEILKNASGGKTLLIYGGTGVFNDYSAKVLLGEAVYTTTKATTTTTTTAAIATPTKVDGKRTNHTDVYKPNYSSPYYLIVYTKNNTVRVLGKGADGGYNKPIYNFLCSTAKSGKVTPAGLYSIDKRYSWRAMFGNVYAQYAVRFYGNYLFHSVPYTKQSASTLEMNEYEKLGKGASLGCVRLCVRDAKWIYNNCPNGTQVRVISGKDGPAQSSTREIPKLKYSSPYSGWDPTDPNPKNPYNK